MILIEDIDKPKTCKECPLKIPHKVFGYRCPFLDWPADYDLLLKRCPIIQVDDDNTN